MPENAHSTGKNAYICYIFHMWEIICILENAQSAETTHRHLSRVTHTIFMENHLHRWCISNYTKGHTLGINVVEKHTLLVLNLSHATHLASHSNIRNISKGIRWCIHYHTFLHNNPLQFHTCVTLEVKTKVWQKHNTLVGARSQHAKHQN